MTLSSFSSIRLSPEMQALLKRWVNLHRVLWLLALVSFFIAWNRGLALLYGLFSLLAALVLVSYVMPRLQLRNVRVTRRVGEDYTAGQTAGISYYLEAGGSRYHVELTELLAFTEKKEHHHFFDKISGKRSCSLEFRCAQRGCFQLRSIQLSSAYPFGIYEFSKSIQLDPEEIMVFPKVVTLSRIPLPIAAEKTTLGEVLMTQKGGRDEFAGVREYCHGDAINRIHWPVSARYQDLVVKEYDKTDRPALLVVLDCRNIFNVGDGSRSTFEYAVIIAASMIRFASRDGMRCFLVAMGQKPLELTIHANLRDYYTLYASLARLMCDGYHPYSHVVEQANKQFPRANLVATFRLDSDTKLPRLSPHVTHIDMEMDTESFRMSRQGSAGTGVRRQGKRLIYRVGADTELEGLFQ